MKFQVGQVVQLRSGGPEMTVHAVLQGGLIHCQWFGGRKLEQGYFSPELLIEPVTDDKKK